ncbi:4'-phosphopantetheinyl transferase family protein [Streptomyces roseus]|uniref:4'-phosphopantetheinyl transferase family protein n=1 Tax=Streptomyces roseus TaxID=66430 RepID=UPI0036B3F04C
MTADTDTDAPDPGPAIRPGEVHVWHLALDDLAPKAFGRLDAALGPQERARRAAYATPLARARYTASHGMLRLLLGHFLGVAAPRVRIRHGPLGKPDPVRPAAAPDLRFSLSHAGGHALVALSVGRAVGVDLDRRRPGFPLEAFTRRYFPAEEHAGVLAAEPGRAARELAFLHLWTRKEALVKAAGARMAIGVGEPVRPRPGLPVTALAQLRPEHPALHGTWSVQNLPPPHAPSAAKAGRAQPPTAAAALALALAGDQPFRVITRRMSHTLTHEGQNR